MQEASRTPNRPDQNRTTPRHIIIKTTSSETKERILKAVREKKQVTYKGKYVYISGMSYIARVATDEEKITPNGQYY
jgi:hypothetical protein